MKKQRKIGLVWKLTGMISLLLLITTSLICIIYIQTFRRTSLDDKYNVLFDTMSLSEQERVADGEDQDVELQGKTCMPAAQVCPQTGLISAAVSSKEEMMTSIMNQVFMQKKKEINPSSFGFSSHL